MVSDDKERATVRMVARDLRNALRRGCGDNSCPFGRKGGMGTNGGCRCHEVIEDVIQRERAAAREQALEEAAKVCDDLSAASFAAVEEARSCDEEDIVEAEACAKGDCASRAIRALKVTR